MAPQKVQMIARQVRRRTVRR
jgi:hypothetical protein